ncbi:MAG: segregation/condensation protein A [Ruminococcus sp.]|jgi:segregation and condensation protein A|nr:segregation/condensation protein A [Ruminococcus sp.]
MPVENEYSDVLKFKLDNFEGPLDLLLFLIQKHKLNINDIPISILLDQYMEYINEYAEKNTEIAAEFLEMAAKLLYIKAASLLPKPQAADILKRELEGRLIEYAVIKDLAARLKLVYKGDTFTVRAPLAMQFDNTYALEHNKMILFDVFSGINITIQEKPPKLDPFEGIVTTKIFSVNSKIVYILKILYRTGRCVLSHMFDEIIDKSERVAAFLAVLELSKSGRILLNDDNTEICFNR